MMRVQGGKDPQDPLNCRSFFAKEPLIIQLFCGKLPVKIRHPVGLSPPCNIFMIRVVYSERTMKIYVHIYIYVPVYKCIRIFTNIFLCTYM